MPEEQATQIRRDTLVEKTACKKGDVLHFSDGKSELVETVCGTHLPVLGHTSTLSISTLRRGEKGVIEEMFYHGRNKRTFDTPPYITYEKNAEDYRRCDKKLSEAGL